MTDILEIITEMIKNDINNFEGYTITEDGTVILTSEKSADKNATPERQKEVYKDNKDCYNFLKAVEKLNPVYDNFFLMNIKQSVLTEELAYNYNILLPLCDTYFIYEKLKTNEKLLGKKKKTKLASEKIKPKTDYTIKTGLIELAMKNFNLIDTTTQKQVLSLILGTIDVANKEDNIEDSNKRYIDELIKLNVH